MESAAMLSNWDRVRELRMTPSVVAQLERGISKFKLIDIMLAVVDGNTSEADKLGVPFLDEIPLDISLRTSSDEGKPIVFQEPDNLISKKYLEIANLIAESLEKQKKPMPTIIQ